MKRYILIYVYNHVSENELLFWEQLNAALLEKGYNLFMLLLNVPNREVTFNFSHFTERLDNVISPKGFKKKFKKNNFKPFLEREEIWYGNSNKDRLTAAKFQKYRYNILLKELNPCLLILGNGQHAGELILNKEASSLNIPVIYIERGSLPNSWHIDKFGMTAGTEIAKKKLQDLDLVDDISNYLKYKAFYLESKFTWWQQPEKSSNSNIRKRFEIPKSKKVILFANQLDNDTSNFLYNPFFNNNLDAFTWFCKTIKRNDYNCFIIVKKHPHYKGNETLFQDVLQTNNIEGVWIDDIPLEDCVVQSDLVCAVNSTLLFEALIYEKPVLQLGDSLLNNKNIVYQIKNKTDYLALQDWCTLYDFENKLNNFKKFTNYLICNELAFFFKESKEMGLNNVNFFTERILPFVKIDTKGKYPKKFLKINNFDKNNFERFLFKFKNKLKRYYKKYMIF